MPAVLRPAGTARPYGKEKMIRTIAIAGTRKAASAKRPPPSISASLAAQGRRVLLVDVDPQGNATMGAGINKNEAERRSTPCRCSGRRRCSTRVEAQGGFT